MTIMKTIRTMVASIILPAALFIGCDQLEGILKSPELDLGDGLVEVPAAGGPAEIAYTLENAVDGEELVIAPESGCDWLYGFEAGERTITFNADPNEGERAREAEVSVSYMDISETFTVRQFAGETSLSFVDDSLRVPAEGGDFTVSYRLETTATNAELVVEADEWITGIDDSTPGKLSFKARANTSVAERIGSITISFAGEEDSMEIIQDGKEAEEEPDEVTFEFADMAIAETSVTFSLIPSDPEMPYTVNLLAKDAEDLYTDEELFSVVLNSYEELAESYGMTLEDFLSQSGYLLTGRQDGLGFRNLTPDTDYIAFAFGMSASGEQLSPISKAEFRTEAVEFVDMTFEITIDVNGLDASINVVPSDTTRYWYPMILEASEFNSYGMTWEDLIQAQIDYYVSEYGAYGYTVDQIVSEICSIGGGTMYMSTPDENTEYIFAVAAVDLMTGLVSSSASAKTFSSGELELMDVEVAVTFDKYYNGTELESADPENWSGASGLAVLPVSFEVVTGETEAIAAVLFSGNLMDEQEYNDALLAYNIQQSGALVLPGVMNYLLPFDTECTLLAAGYNQEDGSLGKICRAYVAPLSESGCSPAEELLEASSQSMVGPRAVAYSQKMADVKRIEVSDMSFMSSKMNSPRLLNIAK